MVVLLVAMRLMRVLRVVVVLRARVRVRPRRVIMIFFPVAVVLGPAQAALRKVIFPLRNFHHVIFWQDRILTLWICVGLVGVALVFALVPWGFVLYYGARLAGVALFGPQFAPRSSTTGGAFSPSRRRSGSHY